MGDWNEHVRVNKEGIEDVIRAFSIGNKNNERERIIDICVANHLSIMNTFYNVTNELGIDTTRKEVATQISQ